MKIPPAAADAFAAAFAAKPNPVISEPRVAPARPVVGETYRILYRNWRDAVGIRTVTVQSVWFGGTQWHPEPQWLFTAFEPETGKTRDFAVAGVLSWDVSPKPEKEPLFWVVWNPAHPSPVKKKYPTKVSAERAAKYLARKHNTQVENIYVMQLSSAWNQLGKKPRARHY